MTTAEYQRAWSAFYTKHGRPPMPSELTPPGSVSSSSQREIDLSWEEGSTTYRTKLRPTASATQTKSRDTNESDGPDDDMKLIDLGDKIGRAIAEGEYEHTAEGIAKAWVDFGGPNDRKLIAWFVDVYGEMLGEMERADARHEAAKVAELLAGPPHKETMTFAIVEPKKPKKSKKR